MKRFYNFLAAAAVVLTPVAMMTAFGWAAYTAILAETGVPALAALSGLATAAAVEAIGIVAGETTLWFHGRADRRWRVAAAILALYVAFGLAVLWSTALALLPVLAGAVYVLVGLRAQAQRETDLDATRAAEAAEWDRERWRVQQADRTAVKLAQVQVQLQAASKQPASSVQASANGHSAAASAAMFQCKQCTSTFSSMQALGGHVRAAHKERT